MNYLINAWLERDQPLLEVREAHTGRTLLRWEGNAQCKMLERGELILADLNDEHLSLVERLGLDNRDVFASARTLGVLTALSA